MSEYYDIIFVYETNFQEKIVTYLIDNKIKNKTFLRIDARNDQIKLPNETIKIDLNSFSGTLKSIKDIFTKKSNLKCNQLVGTFVVSTNSRFFECFIEYEQLVLIDDGIGTPVIIDNPDIKNKSFLRNITSIISKILTITAGYKLKSVREILNKIKHYWSIYPIPTENIISKEYINFFNSKTQYASNEEIAFIGQPLVETKLMSIQKYWTIIKKIQQQEGLISYYPHPREKFHKDIVLPYVEIKENDSSNTTIEEYFLKHGMPKKIISFVSTTLINIKCLEVKETECYYIESEPIKSIYYDTLRKFGIQKYEFYEN